MLKLKHSVLPILLILVFAAYLAAQTKPVEEASGITFVGSWIVTGTPDPATGIPPFVNISTNTQSGSMVSVDPLDGAGVGEWRKSGNHRYMVTFRGFTTIEDQKFPFRVRGDVVLSKDGKTFDGPFVTDIFDNTGAVLFSVPGTVHGVRFRAEKL